MEYRVAFPLAVELFDADRCGMLVVKEAGTYRMVVVPNPYSEKCGKWVVIKGTMIGISLVAFFEIQDEIDKVDLPGIGLVKVEMRQRG